MSRGLNDETVLKAADVYVGTVPGTEYGYKRNLRVTVSVRMKRLDRQDEYETTDHRKVRRPLDFTITWQVWRPDRRDIVLSTPGDGVTRHKLLNPADPRHAALLELAPYHGNAMKAGCVHQGPVYRYGRYGPQVDFEATLTCPETGYRYGHAWLVEELPEGFEQKVRDALAPYQEGRTR